jgi:peptide/nickel transport system substrate-binding protein
MTRLLAIVAATAVALSACSTTTGGAPSSGSTEIVVAGTYPIDSIEPNGPQGGGNGL